MTEKEYYDLLSRFYQIRYLDMEVERKNPTLKEGEQNGIAIAVKILIDELKEELITRYLDRKSVFARVRREFEDYTLSIDDHWNRHNISECDDGWDEYKEQAFDEEFGITYTVRNGIHGYTMNNEELLKRFEEAATHCFYSWNQDVQNGLEKNKE